MSSKKQRASSSMDVDEPLDVKQKKKVSWGEGEVKKPVMKEKPTKSATESFTDLFWHLANIHPDVRVQATSTLVSTLVTLEKEGKKTVQTKNGFTNISDELDYALCRLAKGLLSSRDAARQGFATAFSEVRYNTSSGHYPRSLFYPPFSPAFRTASAALQCLPSPILAHFLCRIRLLLHTYSLFYTCGASFNTPN
jgi:hypothetical protein